MSVTPDPPASTPAPQHSPDPGVPQTADKAKIGLIASAVLASAFLVLVFYYDGKNGTNFTEIFLSLILGILGVGAPTAAAVFKTKNRRRRPEKVHHRG